MILGKLGLSEFANSFGNQPSGFSNLTGQVINGFDADQNPSGSSSGSGAAGAAALSMLTIGTETSGSIISPSGAQSLVGLRPDGRARARPTASRPISASQDTAGPMDRTRRQRRDDPAVDRRARPDERRRVHGVFGPNIDAVDAAAAGPDPGLHVGARPRTSCSGKRIGYNGTLRPTARRPKIAFDALVAAGAIMVAAPVDRRRARARRCPAATSSTRRINEYYKRLGPNAPIKSLAEEVADNQANAHEALKFGNGNHLNSLAADVAPGRRRTRSPTATTMPIRQRRASTRRSTT